MQRRRFLKIAGTTLLAGGAGWAYARFLEPQWWKLTRTTIDLGGAGAGLRMLHVSDMHASPEVPMSWIAEAFRLGVSQRPDLILVTGDFFTGIFNRWDEYVPILRILSTAAPTFGVLGNHDGDRGASGVGGWPRRFEVEGLLERGGINLLYNANRRVKLPGGRVIDLFGVGDLWQRECDAAAAFRGAPARRPEVPRLVLNHNPDAKDRFRAMDWDLMLCGHTHGGQLRVPLVGAPYAPVRDKRYIAGLYAWEGRQLFITRGIGNLHGLRFNCRPEVSLLELG